MNPSYNGVYQMSFKGSSGQKTLIIQLDNQKYNVFTLNFDTGKPEQKETYPYRDPSASDGNNSGITRAP